MPILPIDSGRYGTKEMKAIFEEETKLRYELTFEAEVANAQAKLNMIPAAAANDIKNVVLSDKISVQRVKELESVSDHDIAAIVEAISELCLESSKPWIHYGLTSNDVVDSSTSMQMRDVFRIIETKLQQLIKELLDKARKYQDLPSVGRTHGQHASITAFGLRFAIWANELDLFPTEAATQVIQRERYAEMMFIITLVSSTLDKMAIEIRNLQRTEIDEVQESFKKGQMGSSAVPVKRNPIKSERISSLARIIRSNLNVSLENIALWHERDLSNSANERFIIPMASILIDDMIGTMIKIISGLKINTDKIQKNIELTNGQIFAEFVLQGLILKGLPRFKAYRSIQSIAFNAAENHTHFYDALTSETEITDNISKEELGVIFNPQTQLSASKNIINNIEDKARKMNVY